MEGKQTGLGEGLTAPPFVSHLVSGLFRWDPPQPRFSLIIISPKLIIQTSVLLGRSPNTLFIVNYIQNAKYPHPQTLSFIITIYFIVESPNLSTNSCHKSVKSSASLVRVLANRCGICPKCTQYLTYLSGLTVHRLCWVRLD